jgi:hypothetical protein
MKKIEREIAVYCLTDRQVSALTTSELKYIAKHRTLHINYRNDPTNPLASKNGKVPRREIARLINEKRKGLEYPGDIRELTESQEYADIIRRLTTKIGAQDEIARITKANKAKRQAQKEAERKNQQD